MAVVACGLAVWGHLSAAGQQPLAGIITTIAGTGGISFTGDGGPATAAQMNMPFGVAVDSAGNVYFADTNNNRIRKVAASNGVITTVAGTGISSFTGDGGPATAATLSFPTGVTVDGTGNLFIADQLNHRVRKVTAADGLISTVAGNGAAGFSGDGASATAAQLNLPLNTALDVAGNLYIADTNNQRIRRVSAATGVITTVAGLGTVGATGDGGPATAAQLNTPSGVAVDGAGNLYIADYNNQRVRKVSAATAIITTVAGTGAAGFSGEAGAATSAQLFSPREVAVDGPGNLYIAEYRNHRIRKVDTATGLITTVAGSGDMSFGGDGGAAPSAQLNNPGSIAVDAAGNLFIADVTNQRIRKVTAPSQAALLMSTLAGTGTVGFSGDGSPAAGAQLNGPEGVAVDAAGNLYIADYFNQRIRKISASGVISTFAGNGFGGFSGDGGPATAAELTSPVAVAVDAAGNVYIADNFNQRIRKVTVATGIITTVAGNGASGFSGDGGPATSAQLSFPRGVALDAAGNIYIADTSNNRIRKVTVATGVITTIAGTGTAGFGGDGAAATAAQLRTPYSVAVDTAGNVYIADFENQRVRKVTAATGVMTTIAGTGVAGFSGENGASASARLFNPSGVAVDSSNNVYIADTNNYRIRKILAATGLIRTIMGSANPGFGGDTGAGSAAQLNLPDGVAVDAAGNVYVADTANARVRKAAGPPSSPTGVTAVAAGTTGIRLSWIAPAGATSYTVKRSLTPGAETTIASGITTTFYVDTNITAGRTYYYVVSASSPNGVSPDSAEVSFTILGVGADFDGDGKADISVYRPGTGAWYVLQSGTNYTSAFAQTWGSSTDLPVPGDYDGDGKNDIAIFRPSNGTWYILKSSTNFTDAFAFVWGNSSDVPVPGDYDSDGRTDIAIYRPGNGTWYILQSSTNFTTAVSVAWGVSTDRPVPGDYDGDRRTDLAVYRPENGTWYVLQSSTNFTTAVSFVWGGASDVPVQGDYDGDGRTDIAIYRPSAGTWYVLMSSTNFTNAFSFVWGSGGDVPVPGDYDGDARTDIAVYRESNGTWYVLKSGTNFTSAASFQWGIAGDVPILRRQ